MKNIKTVGQKMLLVLIVLGLIAAIFCGINLSKVQYEKSMDQTLYSDPFNSESELERYSEELEKDELKLTLYTIGLIISIILIIVSLFLIPSINKNAKVKSIEQKKILESKPSLSDLEQLKSLLDKGIITEDEFIRKKNQILNL